MNPLDSFTVERLEDLIEFENFGSLSMVQLSDLAKIALVAKRTKPIAYLTWHQGFRAPDDCEDYLEAYMHETKGKSCDGTDAIPVFDAPPSPQIPDGWIAVPQRLTQNMAEAAKCIDGRLSAFKYDDVYCAMLAAAPKP